MLTSFPINVRNNCRTIMVIPCHIMQTWIIFKWRRTFQVHRKSFLSLCRIVSRLACFFMLVTGSVFEASEILRCIVSFRLYWSGKSPQGTHLLVYATELHCHAPVFRERIDQYLINDQIRALSGSIFVASKLHDMEWSMILFAIWASNISGYPQERKQSSKI